DSCLLFSPYVILRYIHSFPTRRSSDLLIVSMSLTTVMQVVFARLPTILPVLGNLSSLALYTVAFALLYHYLPDRRVRWRQALVRSEEHTSELQSRENLVCRLLLEKKKN